MAFAAVICIPLFRIHKKRMISGIDSSLHSIWPVGQSSTKQKFLQTSPLDCDELLLGRVSESSLKSDTSDSSVDDDCSSQTKPNSIVRTNAYSCR